MDEVQQLITFGGWDRLYAIQELTYQELTLEFLTIFSLEECHIIWTLPDTIKFKVHGERY